MGISLRKNKGLPARKGRVPWGWRGWTRRARGKKRPARFPAPAASKVSAAWACVGNADEHRGKDGVVQGGPLTGNGTASRPLSCAAASRKSSRNSGGRRLSAPGSELCAYCAGSNRCWNLKKRPVRASCGPQAEGTCRQKLLRQSVGGGTSSWPGTDLMPKPINTSSPTTRKPTPVTIPNSPGQIPK